MAMGDPTIVGPELEVTSVSARKHFFDLKGAGKFQGYCPVCGMQLQMVQASIPIHCVGLNCPTCGTADDLRVSVHKLSTQGPAFEFEATLECKTCGRTSTFKKALRRLAEILSIEIGLGGVTIKAKGNSGAKS
jgi:hypothetical protein